jgi:hypothetical protein
MVVHVIEIARLLIIMASRHRSLVFESLARAVQPTGRIVLRPQVGGLRHRHERQGA